MTNNPLQMKVAAPYANALFDFSNEQNVMHKVTADFQNLEIFLKQAPELLEFLNNPLVTIKSKNVINLNPNNIISNINNLSMIIKI